MKTYWLEKRQTRSASTRNISIQDPPAWHSNTNSRHNSFTRNSTGQLLSSSPSGAQARLLARLPSSPTLALHALQAALAPQPAPVVTPSASGTFYTEDRPIYSPITFQDVARRSVANSPTKGSIKGDKYNFRKR